MWEDLLKMGSGAWESVSEGVTQYVDGVVSAKVATVQEQNKNPENLKNAEPNKGKRVDGSTIVERQQRQGYAQQQMINGVDNTVLLIGGALFATVLLFALKGSK